jgi:uncharacterized membrane protein YdbT with pleckstrin-like domain
MRDYIRKTLSPSERLIREGRLHPIFTLRLYAALIAALALIGWAAWAYPNRFAWYYAAAAALVAVAAFLRAILPLWTLEFGLTDNRIIIKRGLIAYKSNELELKAIEEVNIAQSWLGRILDYGTLQVRGIGIDRITLKWVASPLKFRIEIESAIRNATAAKPEPPKEAKAEADIAPEA